MANGYSGPVPVMDPQLWERIKDADWGSGGWYVDGTLQYLHMTHSDYRGGTQWVLYQDPAPHEEAFIRAPMSSSYWYNIAGGELASETNSILQHGERWLVGFSYEHGQCVARSFRAPR